MKTTAERFQLTALILLLTAVPALAEMSEESILQDYSQRVFRPDPATLCAVTVPGDTVVFMNNDNIDSAEEYAVYRVIDFLVEQNLVVIETGGYEWMDWRIVNLATGAVDTTISAPLPSPDGSRLLCFKEDMAAAFIPNGIQVWRLDPAGLVLEFEDIDVPWGPNNAYWETDSVIRFEKYSYSWENWEVTASPGCLKLSQNGIWLPDDPADWDTEPL